MANLSKEYFLRNAFGNNIERSGDPAHLADADLICLSYSQKEYFYKYKIVVGYAISKYNNDYSDLKQLNDPDDYNTMNNFLERITCATSSQDVDKVISDYKLFKKHLDALRDR